MTTVINIKHESGYDVYIGRHNPTYGLAQSKFANPYKIGKDGTREEVIELYRQYIEDNMQLFYAARTELKDKILGCWCKPEPCHGDILVEIANG